MKNQQQKNSKTQIPISSQPYKTIKDVDVAIVGGGIIGLILANALLRTGRRVVLIEAQDEIGGRARVLDSNTPLGLIDSCLHFFPNSEETHAVLTWLQTLQDSNLPNQTDAPPSFSHYLFSAPPVQMHQGRLQPFVGFGDDAPPFFSELAYFLQPDQIITNEPGSESSRPTWQWVNLLKSQFLNNNSNDKPSGERRRSSTSISTSEILLKSTATKLVRTENSEQIDGVVLHGAHLVKAREIIVTVPPSVFANWLPENSSYVSQMAKHRKATPTSSSMWTCVTLDWIHQKQQTEQSALHVFNPKGSTDHVFIGQFHPSDPTSGLQRSQWMTFISADQTEDPECVASVFKSIRRQMKRAYPEALSNLAFERVTVSPWSHGRFWGSHHSYPQSNRPESWKNAEHYLISPFENLWFVHATFSGQSHLLGGLQAARQVLAHERFSALNSDAPESKPVADANSPC